MAQCPFCQTDLGDDFGLIECPSCHKVSFVEIDGEIVPPSEPVAHESQSAPDEPVPAFVSNDDDEFQFDLGEPQTESESQSNSLSPEEDPIQILQAPMPAEYLDPEIAQSMVELFDTDPPVQSSAPSLDIHNLISSSDSGAISEETIQYSVHISGIDSSELRQNVLDIIGDKRFRWDVETQSKAIRNGELHIQGISSIKAAILVNRLRSLPLEVKWEQHATFANS